VRIRSSRNAAGAEAGGAAGCPAGGTVEVAGSAAVLGSADDEVVAGFDAVEIGGGGASFVPAMLLLLLVLVVVALPLCCSAAAAAAAASACRRRSASRWAARSSAVSAIFGPLEGKTYLTHNTAGIPETLAIPPTPNPSLRIVPQALNQNQRHNETLA